jgi:hypothetical protein
MVGGLDGVEVIVLEEWNLQPMIRLRKPISQRF